MRRGITFGVTAYLIWGLFPLYFPLLQPAGALEILAHRMVWSLVVSAIVLTVVRGWKAIRAMPLRVWALVLAGAVADRGQLGHLHLGGQQRPRRRGGARLLHQPAGDACCSGW